MEIIPRERVGSLQFGMSRSEVIAELGLPEEDDRENDEWWYDSGTSLSFNEEGLSSIEIENDALSLFNSKISFLSIDETVALLEKHSFKSKTLSERDEVIVECQMLGLFFVFVEGKLNYIQAIYLPEGFKDIEFKA